MNNKEEFKNDFQESYFLKFISEFKQIKDIEKSILDINKLILPIKDVKDRNIVKSLLFKYAILSFYTNKNLDLVKEFRDQANKITNTIKTNIFLPEYINDIKTIKEEKISIEDFYNKFDKDLILSIEEKCYFSNCETSVIEVIEDNKETYTTTDLIDIFKDDTVQSIRNNLSIVENLEKMLNKKFENVDVVKENIEYLINQDFILPITSEFKIKDDINRIKNIDGVNKIDIILNDFYKHIESKNQNEDFSINQMDILSTIDKYEKMNSANSFNKIKTLKKFFNSDFLNYSVNTNAIEFYSSNQFLSLRKSKIIKNHELLNNHNKEILRVCSKETNIIISGFCFINNEGNKIIKDINELIEYLKFSYSKKNGFYNVDKFNVENFIENLKKEKIFLTVYLFSSDPNNDIIEIFKFINKHSDKIINDDVANSNNCSLIDKNELILFGYDENKIKLPSYEIDGKVKNAKENIKNTVKNNVICQHIIDKRELQILKKQKKFSQYESLSYQFIKKYLTVDFNGNQICKSCSEKINIKGLSDNIDNSLINKVSLVNYNNLESMREYSKFGKTQTSDGLINNLEIVITDFGNIFNILSYSGFTFEQINIRKKFIKDTIDLIINIRKVLFNNYKEIKSFIPSIIKKYNLSGQNNDYYIFNLDNSIYETSKQDIYQKKKRNNMIYYIIFGFLSNLTEQNVIDILNKKIPLIKKSTNIYDDYNKNKKIFSDLKILHGNEKVNILKFNILCFYIYTISRILSQEKYKNKIFLNVEYKNVSLQAQIIIINSLITLINTALAYAAYFTNHNPEIPNLEIQFCDTIKNRFNYQLNNIFSNQKIINDFYKIKTEEIKDTKKIINFEKIEKIEDNSYLWGYQNDPQNHMDGRISLSYINFKHNNQDDQCREYKISNEQKELFHEFFYDSSIKELKCKNCNLPFSKIKYKQQNNEKNNDILLKDYLEKRLKIYCPNGVIHKIIVGKCSFCGYKVNEKPNVKNVEKLYKSLSSGINQELKNNIEFKEKLQSDIEIINRKKRNKKIKENIKDIIRIFKNSFGQSININGQNIFFEENKYYLDYDYKNNPITNSKNLNVEKIKYNNKKLYSLTKDNVKVYYDYYSLLPISYEINKHENKINSNYNQTLKINYSIMEMLGIIFNNSRYVVFKNIGDVKKFINNFLNSMNSFKKLFIIYFQKIIHLYKFKEIDKKDEKQKVDILEINNLMFDIRKYYNKFKITDFKFTEHNLFIDKKLDFIEFDKIYESRKINNFFNVVNLKILYFFDDLKKLLNGKNQIFIEFVIYFIYHYFINYCEINEKNNNFIFKSIINSENITILDKTKINKSIELISDIINQEENSGLDTSDTKKLEKIEENLEYRKDLKNDDDKEETMDIDYDVDNEDDIDYDDNDE